MRAGRLSVIIPAYNAESWIKECIASALRNTVVPDEIVVVDDGSSDGTSDIASEFGRPVRLLRQKNSGCSEARNLGLQESDGRFVQFLDADDVLHHQRFEVLLQCFAKCPGTPLVSASVSSFSHSDAVFHAPLKWTSACEQRNTLQINYLPAASLFERAFLERIGPWNSNLSRWVDLELHARIAALVQEAPCLPFALYGYRQHSGPRISRHNKQHSALDQALAAVTLAHEHLDRSSRSQIEINEYLQPFYLHLARGYAKAGDAHRFHELMSNAARMSQRPAFRAKALAARALAYAAGPRFTSRLIEALLP